MVFWHTIARVRLSCAIASPTNIIAALPLGLTARHMKTTNLPAPCTPVLSQLSVWAPQVIFRAAITFLQVYLVFRVLSFVTFFLISIALDKIESDSRLQCYIGDLRGILSLGVAHIVCTLFPKASRARSVSVAFPQFFLFPLH